MSQIPRLLPLIAIAIGGVVVVRAIGVAPGLFDGAKAWAEEAVPAAAPAASPAPAVCALTPDQLAEQAGISPAELRILQSLQTRRGELDARDVDFATMLPLMATAEQKLDAKVAALAAIKAEVAALLGQVDDKEKAEIDRLVAVYSAMRPREAAAVFASLNDSVRLPVAAAMRPRSLAAVMAQMPPAGARELTEKLAHRFEAQQQLAARAAAAAAGAASPPAAVPSPAPSQTAAASTPGASSEGGATSAPPPAPRPVSRPPARRPAARPASRPAQPAATPAPAGPQPYQASGTAPAATTPSPRTSVE